MTTAGLTPAELEALDGVRAAAARRLEERKKFFGVPDIEFMPSEDDVVVFRLPAIERKTDGGIIIPDHTIDNMKLEESERDKYRANTKVVSNGIILYAGPDGDDWLLSQGIFYGDIVQFGKYAGQESQGTMFTLRANVEQSSFSDVLVMKTRDIRGSFDLWERLYGESPSLRKVMVTDPKGNWMHVYKPIVKEEKAR